MLKKYVIVVRGKISLFSPKTDSILLDYGCYYKSPIFFANGTWQSFDKALDHFHHHFNHFIGWTAEMIEVL